MLEVGIAPRSSPRAHSAAEHCSFCAHLTAKGEPAITERPLAESANFTVWPSVGALVPGWLLLLPKQHVLSLAALPSNLHAELETLTSEMIGRLRRFGTVAAFEHGPACESQPVGCGVDHAHLHIVQTSADLMPASTTLMPELSWHRAESLADARSAVCAGLPYLYVQDQHGRRWIASHPAIPSQLLRRVIANHEGRPSEFNWREFPAKENVHKTVRMLQVPLN